LTSKWRIILVFSLLIASVTLPLLYTYIVTLTEGLSGRIFTYRFHRAVYVVLAGIVLATSGCILQATLRNPLVDHYVLGTGSGALFAVYTTLLLLEHVTLWVISLAAALGGLSALAITILIAESISGGDVAYVLSGIGVTSLFSGLSVLLLYYVASKYGYASLMLTGTFIHSRPENLPYTLLAIILALVGYTLLAKRLNVIMLGDDHAAQLGVNPNVTRLLASIIAGVSASIIVSQFGVIGFLGLVTPHIARFILKTSDNRLVMPLAMALGALLLFTTDTLSRSIMTRIIGEVPAGAVISALGAPFFLLLLIRRFRGGLS